MQHNRIALPTIVVSALAAAVLLSAAGAALLRDAPPQRAHAAPLAAPPANDMFAAPTRMEGVLSPPGSANLPFDDTRSTDGATLEPGETAPCAEIGATVWYSYFADRPGTVVFDTAGSSFDTVLAVYTYGNFIPSPPGAGSLNSAGCDDNGLGAQSRVSVSMALGQTYLVQAGGARGATGTLHLHAQCDPVCPPLNDDTAHAIDLYPTSMPAYESRLTDGATREPGEPTPCANIGGTVWYRIAPYEDVTLSIDTSGSTFDTALAVYRQDNFLPSPPGGLSGVQCADGGGAGYAAKLTFAAKAGALYYVQAGGANGATGRLELVADCIPACPPPNDNLGMSFMYLPMAETWRTAGATLQAGEPKTCGSIGHTIWYQYSVQYGAQKVSLDTAGSDFDTVIAVYEVPPEGPFDAVAGLRQLQCGDRTHDGNERLTFDFQPNRIYAVQVGGHNGASGTLHVNADCDPSPCPPFNDDFANPYQIGSPWGLPGGITLDVAGATTEPGEPATCGNMRHTTWYRLDGWGAARLTFDASGSAFPAALALYDAPADAALTQLGAAAFCATTGAGGARLQWTSQPGHVYYLQAGSEGDVPGMLTLQGTCDAACPPPNDNFNAASYITGGSVSLDISAATLETGEPQACGPIAGSVWFLIPATIEPVHITTAGSGFVTIMAAYVVDGFSPPPGSLRNIACEHPTATATGLDLPPAAPSTSYWVQVGGWGGFLGSLRFSVNCGGSGCDVVGPALSPAQPGGRISGPNTGSGGYLPGARR